MSTELENLVRIGTLKDDSIVNGLIAAATEVRDALRVRLRNV